MALRQDGILQSVDALPRLAAVGADVNAGDASRGRSRRCPSNLPPARVRSARSGHAGSVMIDLASITKLNIAGRAVGQRIGVLRRFLARHERAVGQLDPPHPLHVRVAFEARQEQPRRIALLGPRAPRRSARRRSARRPTPSPSGCCASSPRRRIASARNHVAFGRRADFAEERRQAARRSTRSCSSARRSAAG